MTKWIALPLAVLAVAACHKQQRKGDMIMSPTVSVEVTNNFTPPDQVTVFILTDSGQRQLLGTASPGRTLKFSYQPGNASSKFTLLAQRSGGGNITSQQFTCVDAVRIGWDLRSNLVQVYTE
jgi:hypothetical protein